MKRVLHSLFLALVWAAFASARACAADSDDTEIAAAVNKWVSDFNKGDMRQFLAACAPTVSVVDGFPPYAWPSCAAWMDSYKKNSKAIQLTQGELWVGKPIVAWVTGGQAYMVYPARFSDREKDKPTVYTGTWTITLQKTPAGWLFTGSASAWTH
jgi:ketosteroid isomerase-like protein